MPLQRLDDAANRSAGLGCLIAPDAQPFVRHAFLSALEDSASLGPQSGWQAEHLLHWEGDRLVAALPSYHRGTPTASTCSIMVGPMPVSARVSTTTPSC